MGAWPEQYVMFNTNHIDNSKFNDESIVKEAKHFATFIKPEDALINFCSLHYDVLEDETNPILNYGSAIKRNFIRFEPYMDQLKDLKAYNKQHEKKSGYKSFHMVIIINNTTVMVTTRETYSLFNLFGDIGGLYEFFLIVGSLVVQ